MNVKEIVKAYLREHGYDGLYTDSYGCGCEDDDLIPCGDYTGDCQPGYKVPCDCGECEWRECERRIVPERNREADTPYRGTVWAECDKCGAQCPIPPGITQNCICGGILRRKDVDEFLSVKGWVEY